MFNKAVVSAFKSENCPDQLHAIYKRFLESLEVLSGKAYPYAKYIGAHISNQQSMPCWKTGIVKLCNFCLPEVVSKLYGKPTEHKGLLNVIKKCFGV